jgi:DNA/RNA-binding domain of Phe-tRNA-synthetase-like protein
VRLWREAYLSFGVKPRTARSSVEALLRRASTGLPRIDRLTDIYNAVSVTSLLPIGGEDSQGYVGVPRLVIATGSETFDTVADGQPLAQHPEPGEPVWRDDRGVTCRRWNWRQCVRTRLRGTTTDALFIIDGLGPDAQARGDQAATTLIDLLAVDSPSAAFTVRAVRA